MDYIHWPDLSPQCASVQNRGHLAALRTVYPHLGDCGADFVRCPEHFTIAEVEREHVNIRASKGTDGQHVLGLSYWEHCCSILSVSIITNGVPELNVPFFTQTHQKQFPIRYPVIVPIWAIWVRHWVVKEITLTF